MISEIDEYDIDEVEMDRPVPKPRTLRPLRISPPVPPLPQPRAKVRPVPPHASNSERVTATSLNKSNILRSLGSVSKQITDDVAAKVSSSAKTANDKLEKGLNEGSRLAKGTIKKTINTTREVRDNITKSVIEGTMSLKLRKPKIQVLHSVEVDRSTSMPPVKTDLFDNICFYSPLQDSHDRFNNRDFVKDIDNSSYRSSYRGDSDSVSNLSFESREYDQSIASCSGSSGHDQFTYDTPKTSRTNSVIEPLTYTYIPEPEVSEVAVGTPAWHEMQEAEKRDKILTFQMKKQGLYENWSLPFYIKPAPEEETPEEPAVSTRPSKSTIIEFDPLKGKKSENKFEGMSNELLLLESFLVRDTDAKAMARDPQDDDFDFAETDYYNPPTPPERSDSLADDDDDKLSEACATFTRDSNSNWYVPQHTPRIEIAEIGLRENLKVTDTVMRKFSRKLRLDGVLSKPTKVKVENIEKPPVNHLPVTHYSGMLSKVVTAGKVDEIFRNSHSRYCMLSDQQLICYSDPTSGIIKESYLLENVFALQIVLPVSSSMNDSYCFELWVSCGGGKTARKVVFTCGSVSERRNWAQKIAEHLTGAFLPKYTAEFTRMGWCYLKEGVTGKWRGVWLMLTRRILLYTNSESTVTLVDLRKTKCVVLQDADEEAKNLCPSDTSSNLLLDCPLFTMYLRFPHERLLKDWRYMLKLAAHNNGAYIHHQQLTNDDVPVLVAKCISFIYAHGSVSEGIYRRAGSTGTLSELLSRFRRDAWSVQLSIGEHTEHDVAGVLKRFLRDLPETLLPRTLRNALFAAIDIRDESSRFTEYRRLMNSLSVVARNTARKLFAHLHFLHTMAHANKMNAENLASVWAPTIMPPAMTSNVVQTAWSNKEVFVVRDLILHYESIWEPTDSEKKTEMAVRQVLMRVLSNSAPSAPKAAGDLKVWIYIKDRSTCHQVASDFSKVSHNKCSQLSPSKTAADVCVELCDKAKMESHLLMLEEVICAESMRRIVHIDEIVLDVVLRWGYWDEEDRKDNYLLLKENSILQEMEALRHSNSLVCGELKFANESSKSFKPHMFEFQNGCLCYFKDKQGSHKIEEWNIKNIFWYVGHEPKRNPQSRWAITFTPRNKQKRTKEKPWFGCTIAGAVTEDRLKWMAAMMFGEHSNLLPTPRLVIT